MKRLLTASIIILLFVTSCTRLSYPEDTRTLFGGDTSVIITDGGDDLVLEQVFFFLEELDEAYARGDVPAVLSDRVVSAAALAGASADITDSHWRSYASEAAARLLMDSGVKGGVVSVAGCVWCIGAHPDGGPWRVALADPVEGRGESYATVDSPEGAVITAYGNASSGLASVSVLSGDAVLASVVSERVLETGLVKGKALLRELSLSAVMLTVSDEIIRISGQEQRDSTRRGSCLSAQSRKGPNQNPEW